MPRREHSAEEMAQDLADWIESTAQSLALAMTEGDASPGAATLTKDQQMDYYHNLLYQPDGQPNIAGRQRFLTEIGPKEQKAITDALLRRHADRTQEMQSYG